MRTQIPIQSAALDHSINKQGIATFITLLVIAFVLGVYHETAWSIVAIWNRSDTYAHGFLIVPFSMYMIWKRRSELAATACHPNYLPLLILAGLGFGWLLASLASVLAVEQYTLVAMIPFIVWAILGFRFFYTIAFPLAYLLFAVPFGEMLIPPLIDFTADFTVRALQFSGIPVYREGNYFSIPSGNWSVVEACSGLRYLIASVTLGTLYAYLTYQSIGRRLAFIGLAVVIPIIANGLRAYLIVMIGHLSDMQLAVGVDHLIYGWLFFGLVMLLLFWIGSFWREDHLETPAGKNPVNSTQASSSLSIKATLGMAGLVMLIAAIWPIYLDYLSGGQDQNPEPEINIVDPSGKWELDSAPFSEWKPGYVGTPKQYVGHFRNDSQQVSLYITYYRNQHQGNELINSGNLLVAGERTGWLNLGANRQDLLLGNSEFTVNQNQLHAPTTKLLSWRWYWLIDQETISPYFAKVMLAINQLLGKGDDGAEIIIVANYEIDQEEAALVLREFLADMMPAISAGLHAAKQN